MTQDKITVDEPLISTDVDSLIRTLSERKRVSLNDLRQLCKIDKKTMEKWLAVLEDEGYINVEYGIRGTFVNWVGLGMETTTNYVVDSAPPTTPQPTPEEPSPTNVPPTVDQPVQEEVSTITEDTPEASESVDSDSESDVSSYEETVDDSSEGGPEPEELLSEYLARKKEKGSLDVNDLRATILTKLDDGEDSPEDLIFSGSTQKEEPKEVESVEEPEPPVAQPEPIKSIREQIDVRELMSAYLAEINKEKAEIDALKKEKEALYRDKFATIEGKMQADIAVLSEKVIEKQSRIAELKERVLELPDKVDELNRLQREMDRLKKEGRMALDRTKRKADEFVSTINDSRIEVEDKVREVDSVLSAQSDKLKEFETLSSSLDSKSEKLRTSLDNAKAQVDELSATMSTLLTDLQQVEQMKSEINSMTDMVKSSVADRGEELKALEAELEGIAKMEHWVQEYVRDYEEKVDEIEDYVSRSDDELADLKSAAESVYMREYLGQLESMTEDYQNALYDTVSKEQDIDKKITDSKSRITELVKESQDLIKKVKSEVPGSSGYDRLLARVKEKTGKVKSVIVEKQSERAKLSEDSKNTRRTPPMSKTTSKPSKTVKKKRK
ncbi:Chromosome partition protein Smc [Candidatus Bilamarchaeum dharawalense]|uniref:Chromosome partition protein Smc n=1 Tax=Candidatus Bilamarchaeum dharawalense TaxID=2885759 RepID=A0A5E4LVE5_9ARCH|nr:Chromosome partition protein Smc [Candidatus Bilamarchaeum dharawalense]